MEQALDLWKKRGANLVGKQVELECGKTLERGVPVKQETILRRMMCLFPAHLPCPDWIDQCRCGAAERIRAGEQVSEEEVQQMNPFIALVQSLLPWVNFGVDPGAEDGGEQPRPDSEGQQQRRGGAGE